jgi:hypothetical protein
MILGAALFLAVWTLATCALSRLAWCRRPSLTDRLQPFVDGDPTREIEDWLRERAQS